MKKLLVIAVFVSAFGLNAQQADANWSLSKDSDVRINGARQIVPQKYMVFHLNGMELKNQMFAAPNDKTTPINNSEVIVSLPCADGTIQKFKVVESSIMEAALQEVNPDIRTFSLKGIDDPYANGKADWNEFGFHMNIRSINGDYFVDPYCVGNTSDYIVYYTRDFKKDPAHIIPEVGVKDVHVDEPKKKEEEAVRGNKSASSLVGQNLRTYRLAVACTGEYAVAATGIGSPSKAQVLAKIVTSINRVNSVYETEVAVRLVLVATETNVIFTSAGSDPFNGNNNAGVLITESQSVISATIGSANYDIGHTFSTGGGGLASLGCVCNSSTKAQGITGSPSPVGDPYDIDYVAHEMGHQFRGNHSFNSTASGCSGNRNGSTAMEPGSGVTIMGYAGLCGSQDLASNSIPYFHAVSFDEIINFTQSGGGGTCPVTSTTGNQPPVVTGPGNFTIPKATAFYLTGSATDPNGDAITYSWEEVDAGVAGNWNSGNKPFFRSYVPSASPTRFFPYNSLILNHAYTTTKGEYVPQSPQNLNFRLTARDNKTGGGGVAFANSQITVDNAGPFLLTYPNASGLTWYQGGQVTITWNVNGTDAGAVNCDSIRILISYNNGNSYSVLNNSTPNDGAEIISVPTVTAQESFCRVKIEGKGNIFLDVSDNTFDITTIAAVKNISGNNELKLNAWPNPAADKVNVSAGNLDSKSAVNLKITDVTGRLIRLFTYYDKTELKEELDLSGINQGIYFIHLSNANQNTVFRIVKE
ncbi:MAG: T9SS type A sorting domain-containing protein [Sphingobacteriaceae bacterium]|nr:T9SS type A sorting domain-containing protein [Sphingobacteriaceae bacterium]